MKNKSFSFINIAGLSVGMASAILILLWIQNEVSYDQFHEKKDRIYEAWNRDNYSGDLQCWSTTPKVLAKTLQNDFPEVEQVITEISLPCYHPVVDIPGGGCQCFHSLADGEFPRYQSGDGQSHQEFTHRIIIFKSIS